MCFLINCGHTSLMKYEQKIIVYEILVEVCMFRYQTFSCSDYSYIQMRFMLEPNNM